MLHLFEEGEGVDELVELSGELSRGLGEALPIDVRLCARLREDGLEAGLQILYLRLHVETGKL